MKIYGRGNDFYCQGLEWLQSQHLPLTHLVEEEQGSLRSCNGEDALDFPHHYTKDVHAYL